MTKLSPHEFQDQGESLAIGRKGRFNHTCGEGRSLIVSREPAGISAWCFRCRAKGFIPAQRSLAERIAALQESTYADQEATGFLHLPGPAERDPQKWPDPARLWLYKAGFSNTHIQQLGFYWNERMQRVVMPVMDGGKLVYWQARGFDNLRAKYINPEVDRQRLVAKYGKPGECLVLTEDILSAAKVARVAEAWSLMGVDIRTPVLLEVATKGVPVIVALDPDPPGKAGGNAVVRQLQLLGVTCCTAYMQRDPKLHSTQEITSWLKQTLSSLAAPS